MSALRNAVFLPVIGLLAGCSSLQVQTDWDRDIDFNQYQTYVWAPSQKAPKTAAGGTQQLMDKRIRRAVDEELARIGFARSEDRQADLLAVYRATTQDRVDVYQHYGYRRSYGANVYRYQEGTLTVMFVDPKKNDEVVWQGWASDVVSDPSRAEEQIYRAVRAILKRFPPN